MQHLWHHLSVHLDEPTNKIPISYNKFIECNQQLYFIPAIWCCYWWNQVLNTNFHTHTHNKQSLFLFQLGDDSLLFYFRLLQNKPLQQKSIPNNSKCLSLDFFTKRWKARTLNKALIKLDKRSEFIVLFKKSLSGLVGNTVRLMKWRLFQFSG